MVDLADLDIQTKRQMAHRGINLSRKQSCNNWMLTSPVYSSTKT